MTPASANPVIGGAGIGASVGGTILSVLGAKQSGDASVRQFQYQAGMAQVAKRVALQNRDFAVDAGGKQEQMYGLKARNVMGKIVAAQGASGIDPGSGTSVDVRTGQKTITDMDTTTIRNNTARRAYGYEVEAAQDDAQTGLYNMAAEDVKRATKLNITSSILSGASSVSSKWLQGQSVGLWGGTAKAKANSGWGEFEDSNYMT